MELSTITSGAYPDYSKTSRYPTSNNQSIERFARLSAFQQKSSAISIVTDEGDVVTLSRDQRQQAQFATYDALGRTSDSITAVHAESSSISASEGFSISVQGDLNEQEQKDINKIVKKIDSILNHFYNGDIDKVMKEAQKIGDLGSLSSVSASATMTKSVSFESMTRMQSSTSQALPEGEDDSSTPAPKKDSLEELVSMLKQMLNDTEVEKKHFLKPLGDVFRKLIDAMKPKEEDDSKGSKEKDEKIEHAKQVQSELLKALTSTGD